jgi:hypothetical protein
VGWHQARSTIGPIPDNCSGRVAWAADTIESSPQKWAYYLGLDRSQSAASGAPERRHTIGVKWSGGANGIDLNYDAMLQWGEFGDASIRAWPSPRWVTA